MTEKQQLHTVDVPQGFSARPMRMDEMPAIVALLNRTSLDMLGYEDFTLNELQVEYADEKFDIEKDSMGIFNEVGEPVAFADMFATNPTPVYPGIMVRVHPDYMNRGLGWALTEWAVARASSVLDRVPADARVAVRSGTPHKWEAGGKLLQEAGFSNNRSFYQMRKELSERPEFTWPEGFSLRPYQHPEDAEMMYRAAIDSFRDHYGFVEEPFEEGFARFKHHRFQEDGFDPDLWFFVMDGEEVAAFVMNRAFTNEDPDQGWVNTLGVRRAWRKRGLGYAILLYSFQLFFDRGKTSAGLGVDASNLTGALRLYEKAGMNIHLRWDSYEYLLRDGEELSTVALETQE
jgi:GNAT superfamily N-acetyltransferase